jgi:predicted nucleic acid-binding protein
MAVFVDTGAWFAYFVRRDPDHRAATEWMRRNRQPLETTDYILDELLTLLKMRENYRVAVAAGEALREQRVARIEHVTIEDIARSWDVFRQYHDKDLSFTDCTSKVMMERLRLIYAFAFDNHFEQFGTVTRVP